MTFISTRQKVKLEILYFAILINSVSAAPHNKSCNTVKWSQSKSPASLSLVKMYICFSVLSKKSQDVQFNTALLAPVYFFIPDTISRTKNKHLWTLPKVDDKQTHSCIFQSFISNNYYYYFIFYYFYLLFIYFFQLIHVW